jgi:hypothetical protein
MFLHVVICKFKYRSFCTKHECTLQHLNAQPKPKPVVQVQANQRPFVEVICRLKMNNGQCENQAYCMYLHPVKCSFYSKFGLANKNNPRGCIYREDCMFLHVVICKFKYRSFCTKYECTLQHLNAPPEPEPVETYGGLVICKFKYKAVCLKPECTLPHLKKLAAAVTDYQPNQHEPLQATSNIEKLPFCQYGVPESVCEEFFSYLKWKEVDNCKKVSKGWYDFLVQMTSSVKYEKLFRQSRMEHERIQYEILLRKRQFLRSNDPNTCVNPQIHSMIIICHGN